MNCKVVLPQSCIKLWKFCFFSLLILFLFTIQLTTVFAQNENIEQVKDQADAKEFVAKVRRNLNDKYPKGAIGSVTSSIEKRLHGAKIKSLSIDGEIKPKTTVMSVKKEHEKARELALGFLIENGNDVFDNKDINDIKEFNIGTSKDESGKHTITHLYFNKYVGNLKLEGSNIHIVVKDDDHISYIDADVVPVSNELLKAVKSKTLSEEEVKKIVMDDLNKVLSSNTDSMEKNILNDITYEKIRGVEKLAISVPPYVVFSVKSVWLYTIDAFTGRILGKTPTWASGGIRR